MDSKCGLQHGDKNMDDKNLIEPIIKEYYIKFKAKLNQPSVENNDFDELMNLFNISPELKRDNRQFWGRHLGKLWEKMVVELAKTHCQDFQPELKINKDQLCDLIIGSDAIDTKYRIGSGDSGTLKKLKDYGTILQKKGYNPIMLIVRDDNLPSAIAAAKSRGWNVLTDVESFSYLKEKIGIDINDLIQEFCNVYHIIDE